MSNTRKAGYYWVMLCICAMPEWVIAKWSDYENCWYLTESSRMLSDIDLLEINGNRILSPDEGVKMMGGASIGMSSGVSESDYIINDFTTPVAIKSKEHSQEIYGVPRYAESLPPISIEDVKKAYADVPRPNLFLTRFLFQDAHHQGINETDEHITANSEIGDSVSQPIGIETVSFTNNTDKSIKFKQGQIVGISTINSIK